MKEKAHSIKQGQGSKRQTNTEILGTVGGPENYLASYLQSTRYEGEMVSTRTRPGLQNRSRFRTTR